jgi:hypothetical protein
MLYLKDKINILILKITIMDFNMRKNKGLSLFETLMTLSILLVIVTGIFYWMMEAQRNQFAVQYGKELSSIVEGFDKRLSIDGLDVSNFKNGTTWNNSNIQDLLTKELISRTANCGKGSGWVPQLATEKDAKLIDCGLWARIPYSFKPEAVIGTDSEGFVNSFRMMLKLDNDASFKELFPYLNKMLMSARHNNKEGTTGSNNFYFADAAAPDTKITSTKCYTLGSACVIIAEYYRSGGAEFLRIDGKNSMVGSAVTFKDTRTSANKQCVKWVKVDDAAKWESRVVDCGVGIHKETGYPVTVDVAVDYTTQKEILLDKLCIVYKYNGAQIVDSGEKAPCGMVKLDGTNTIYQLTNGITADNGTIRNIYATDVVSEQINTNFLNVKKDLDVAGLTTTTDIKVKNSLDVGGKSHMVGDLTVDSRITTNEFFDSTKKVVSNGSCAKIGLIGTDSTGKIFSCQGYQWKPSGSPTVGGAYWLNTFGGGCRVANPYTGNCSCEAGSFGFLSGQAFQYTQWDVSAYICLPYK